MEVAVSTEQGSSSSAPAVAMRGVNQVFRDSESGGLHHVVRDLDLQIRPGELLAIVGKSGCGKTTVLNQVAGLLEPTSGTIDVLGSSPRGARHRTAYMFARDALLPWRRALRNVTYGLEIRGVPRREREETARAQLARVGLADAATKYPVQLSQGMRQRVALARTWSLNAELILMDEPFAALDTQTRSAVQHQFLTTWEERRTSVLLVTHDLNEAAVMADRIIVLNAGRIQREVEVPFPRPRDLTSLRHDDRFRSFVIELADELDLAVE